MARTKKFKYNEQGVINSLAQFNTQLDEHIGRTVRYLNPTCLIEHELFVIRHIQKDYKGDLAYNLVCISGEYAGSPAAEFGRCTSVNKVYFMDEMN
jgi:hypothetical protein